MNQESDACVQKAFSEIINYSVVLDFYWYLVIQYPFLFNVSFSQIAPAYLIVGGSTSLVSSFLNVRVKSVWPRCSGKTRKFSLLNFNNSLLKNVN